MADAPHIIDVAVSGRRWGLMLFAGAGLLAFGIWGLLADLGQRRVLPFLALGAGLCFALLAIRAAMARGPAQLELHDAELVMHDGSERAVIPLDTIRGAFIVEAPMGRAEPILCVISASGGVIEVAAISDDGDRIAGMLRDAATASPSGGAPVDYVSQLSPLGPCFVTHTDPIEPPTDHRVPAAVIMRRIATGKRVATSLSRARAVLSALKDQS